MGKQDDGRLLRHLSRELRQQQVDKKMIAAQFAVGADQLDPGKGGQAEMLVKMPSQKRLVTFGHFL